MIRPGPGCHGPLSALTTGLLGIDGQCRRAFMEWYEDTLQARGQTPGDEEITAVWNDVVRAQNGGGDHRQRDTAYRSRKRLQRHYRHARGIPEPPPSLKPEALCDWCSARLPDQRHGNVRFCSRSCAIADRDFRKRLRQEYGSSLLGITVEDIARRQRLAVKRGRKKRAGLERMRRLRELQTGEQHD